MFGRDREWLVSASYAYARHQRNGDAGLVALLGSFAAAEEGEGALAGAVHHLLIVSDDFELVGDVGQIPGAAVFDRILESFEFGVEAEAIVTDFNIEAAALFQSEGDGAELVGDALEHWVAGPDKCAGAVAVG